MTTPLDHIQQVTRSASDIAAELRREFELALYARYGTQPKPDPVLATLFHSLAVQVARVYDEAATVLPVAVLDDLIAALDLPVRTAEPAQTVVWFTGIDHTERVSPETQLIGYARTGEQIGFAPDDTVQLSPSTLAFAAVFENGRLQTIPGAQIPGTPLQLPPAAVPLSLASPPTLFLAFTNTDTHLSELGLFTDILPQDEHVARALRQSPWYLLNENGRVHEDGVMRSTSGRGGVQLLDWFGIRHAQATQHADDQLANDDSVAARAPVGEGPYGTRTWIMPVVPADRRSVGTFPTAIASVANRLIPADHQAAYDQSFAWVQIGLPAGITGVANALQRIAINCVAASNVEIWNEQLPFDRAGSTVALRPEGNSQRHLMGVLSVTGENGTRYTPDADVSAEPAQGRFRVRGARLECRPSRASSGRLDNYAMVRLLYCDGARANGLEPGDVRRIESKLDNVTAQITNLTVSRGGAAPLVYADARLRFAELLRSRERVVTAGDMEIAARAYEPRIRDVRVTSTAETTKRGIALVNAVTVRVNPVDFADPDAELTRLSDSLQRHLESRCTIGHNIRVRVERG